jgi:quercetin dioxygenase-like cupin family protein
MKQIARICALTAAACLLVSAGYALGRQAPPTDYHLVRQQVLAEIDLAAEIDGVRDRELRLSRATIEPHGHIGLHGHRGDPTIVYVLSGVLTNHHDDGTAQQFHPGEAFAEFGPGAHWVENSGAVPVTFIVANIHHRQ